MLRKNIFFVLDVIYVIPLFFKSIYSKKSIFNQNYTLVTACDENHFIYLYNLINKYKKYLNRNVFSNFIIFSIGLSDEQIKYIKSLDFIELRIFDFDSYPNHYKKRLASHNMKIGGFAWKPTMLKIISSETKNNIIWFDSANLFNLNILFFKLLLNERGFISFYSTGKVIDWTYNSVLRNLKVSNDLKILNSRNLMGGVIGFNPNNQKAINLIDDWEKLVSDENNIFPEGSSISNHRHDQSLLSILYWQNINLRLPEISKLFGISVQNWPNKVLFFFDEKNDIRKSLLLDFKLYSTSTNSRCKVIFLLNTESLSKIPIRLFFNKKIILFVTDINDFKLLNKFRIKNKLTYKFIDTSINSNLKKSKKLKINLENIQIIVKNELDELNEEN